jgi:hypothetical protein
MKTDDEQLVKDLQDEIRVLEKRIDEMLVNCKKIKDLIVEKDPDDDDKFLRKIWNICEDIEDKKPQS